MAAPSATGERNCIDRAARRIESFRRREQPADTEHARRQHAGAPHDGGCQVGELESDPRHFAQARRERRDRAQRAEEPSDEHRRQAPVPEECDATRASLRDSGQNRMTRPLSRNAIS
jgi:hypothetical protein